MKNNLYEQGPAWRRSTVTMKKKNSYGLEVNKQKLIWGYVLTDYVNNQFYFSQALLDKVSP